MVKKRRKSKDKYPPLQLVWSYKPVRLMTPEQEEELMKALQPFKDAHAKMLRERADRERWENRHTEHDPNLPPAA